MHTQSIEVALLPEMIESALDGRVAVVIDVLRATTTITEALARGALRVIPCLEVSDAWEHAARHGPGTLLGGERHGEPIEGFDLGNSPLEYTSEVVSGREVVFTTTNGTRALLASTSANTVLLASFTNLGAVAERLRTTSSPITIVCAGTNRAVTSEDALLAGAICDALSESHVLANDQASLSRHAWRDARSHLPQALANSNGGRNLAKLGRDMDVAFAAQIDRHIEVSEFVDGAVEMVA